MKYKALSFICLMSLFSISSSYAETEVKDESNTINSEDILTQTELSNCKARAKRLTQTAEQLKDRSKQLQVVKNNMNQLEQERTNEYKDINFHNKASVAEYNQANQQLNQLSQSYTTDAMHFNTAVKQYKADSLQLIHECDDKQYFLNQ